MGSLSQEHIRILLYKQKHILKNYCYPGIVIRFMSIIVFDNTNYRQQKWYFSHKKFSQTDQSLPQLSNIVLYCNR